MGTRSQSIRRNASIPLKEQNRRVPKGTLKRQRAVAKVGMAGSLGALFVSGFFKFQGAKSLHLYSGFGLVAFTVWHHFLNQSKSKPPRSHR